MYLMAAGAVFLTGALRFLTGETYSSLEPSSSLSPLAALPFLILASARLAAALALALTPFELPDAWSSASASRTSCGRTGQPPSLCRDLEELSKTHLPLGEEVVEVGVPEVLWRLTQELVELRPLLLLLIEELVDLQSQAVIRGQRRDSRQALRTAGRTRSRVRLRIAMPRR
jgi:hypothetical protein